MLLHILQITATYLVRFLIVYAVIGLMENITHRHLMHYKKLANYFNSPYLASCVEDHMVHHRCYKLFDHEEGSCGLLFLGIRCTTELASVALPALICLYFDWITPVIFVVVAPLHAILWTTIHTEMHRRKGTWFRKTWLFKKMARHHFLHHRHMNTNYSGFFLGWDWILGTHAKETAEDREAMTHEHWVIRPQRAQRVSEQPA